MVIVILIIAVLLVVSVVGCGVMEHFQPKEPDNTPDDHNGI